MITPLQGMCPSHRDRETYERSRLFLEVQPLSIQACTLITNASLSALVTMRCSMTILHIPIPTNFLTFASTYSPVSLLLSQPRSCRAYSIAFLLPVFSNPCHTMYFCKQPLRLRRWYGKYSDSKLHSTKMYGEGMAR